MVSAENIQLKNKETGEVVQITPFTEFEALPIGSFINMNQARIMDKPFGTILRELSPGETIKESLPVKEVPKKVTIKPKQEKDKSDTPPLIEADNA